MAALCAFVVIGPSTLFGAFYTMFVLGAFAVSLVPMRVDAGADGVLLRWLAMRWFVAYASLADVGSYGYSAPVGVRLAPATGVPLLLHVGQFRGWLARRWAERMRAQWAAVRGAELPSFDHLARRGRPTREWIGALRASTTATYRGAAVDVEDLWAIALSPASSPEERAAASAALTAQPSDARVRLRVAAAEVAEPRVRAVLERAATGDDEALERALERFR